MKEFKFHDPQTGKVISITEDGQYLEVSAVRNVDGIINRAQRLGNDCKTGKDVEFLGSVPIELYLKWEEEGRLSEKREFDRLLNTGDYSRFFTGRS